MKDSALKQLLMLTASAFFIALTVAVIMLILKSPWHENIRAQVINEPFSKSITVSAEGKVTAKPDIAYVNISVVTESKNVKQAVEEGNKKMNSVHETLKQLKIDEKDIKTTLYYLTPNYDWSIRSTTPNIIGYKLTQEVQVKIRNLEDIDSVIDRSISAGANQVGQLSFDVDDPRELEKQARDKAFKIAEEKAKEMAKSAGVKLGDVITFSEHKYTPTPYYSAMRMEDSFALAEDISYSTPILTGQKDFSTNISITYSIK